MKQVNNLDGGEEAGGISKAERGCGVGEFAEKAKAEVSSESGGERSQLGRVRSSWGGGMERADFALRKERALRWCDAGLRGTSRW
jgi:hypothetical protein